jgi:biofilm protein TabA
MILDFLDSASTYFALGESFERAFRYIRETDFALVTAGRYELDGDRVVALVSDYDTLALQEGRWEAHRRHVDVQYVARGEEQIGYAHLSTLAAEPYDESRDLIRAPGDGVTAAAAGQTLLLRPDRFIVLFPQDAHMPGLATAPQSVRKVVVKIRLPRD